MLLRAAVTEGARLERVRLVGDDGAGKFGMDAADLVDAARLAARSEHLELLGLHAFGASNVLEAGALVAHAATTGSGCPRARETERDHGPDRRRRRRPGDPVRAARGVARPGRARSRPGGDRRRLAGRPVARRGAAPARARALPGRAGRRLPGHASWTRRRSMGRRSRSSMAASITSFDRRWSGRSIVSGCSARRPAGPCPVTVAGPLCSGLDVLATGVAMAPPSVGDLVAVLDVGAYGFTESMPYFLSHPIPAEVVARDGRAELDPAAAGARDMAGRAARPRPGGRRDPSSSAVSLTSYACIVGGTLSPRIGDRPVGSDTTQRAGSARGGRSLTSVTTMRDIARAAGVSQSTVSRVLNDAPTQVQIAAETRERVMAAAGELGYRPNPHARSLRGASTMLIGAVVRDFSDPFFAGVIEALAVEAMARGYNVVLGHAHGRVDEGIALTVRPRDAPHRCHRDARRHAGPASPPRGPPQLGGPGRGDLAGNEPARVPDRRRRRAGRHHRGPRAPDRARPRTDRVRQRTAARATTGSDRKRSRSS